MCGRGGLDYDWKTLWAWMDLIGPAPDGGVRRLNVAPSRRHRDGVDFSRLPVVRSTRDGRGVDELVWPLIPTWLKGDLPKYSTANCRTEAGEAFSATVSKKPTFRLAWKHQRRCLVPMSWFYEWDKRQSPSQPWRVFPVDDPLLVMAGLWERSTTPDGQAIDSFTILTTEPNRVLAGIGHHRAPVLIERPDFETWLTGDDDLAEKLIVPPADEILQAEPVTRRVNNPGYQGEDLMVPDDVDTGGESDRQLAIDSASDRESDRAKKRKSE